MNKTRALYKAFSSNLEMPKPNGEKKVKLYNRFGMIAFIGIMLPIAVAVGYVTYVLTDFLYIFDGNSYGLLSELDLISAFAMIFGMPLMFSVLYFSSDLQFLTALPVSPTALYVARFWHTFKAENVMTSNVLFAIYIGYFMSVGKNAGLSAALNPVAIIASVIGLYGSLLIPLIYCAIVAMLLMLLLKRFNRSDIYYNTSLVLFVVFALLFLLSFRSYGKVSTVNYLDSLVGGNNLFTTICNVLFPGNYLTTLSIRHHSVLPLIGAVAIMAALYFISVLIAHFTYRQGLFAAAVISNKKVSRKTVSSAGSHKIFTSLVIKEIKVLMRTMTYRMNCVYANLLWPVAAVVFIFQAPKYEFFKVFEYNLKNGDPYSHVILFDMIKYLPADLDKQIRAKVLVAILFTFIPEVIAVIAVSIRMGVVLMLPLYVLISFICIFIATMIGIVMDSISPYTVWSDELSALRGNLNCFFNLASEMIAAAVIGAASYGIYLLSSSSVITISVVSLLLIAGGAAGFFIGLPGVRKNIELLK